MRPPLAAVLGIVLMIALAIASELVTASLLVAPDGAPLPVGRTFLSVTLGCTFGAAVVGGFAAAHATSARRGVVVGAVALAGLVLGVLSSLQAPPDAPLVVAWAMPVLAVLGSLAGGAVRSAVPR